MTERVEALFSRYGHNRNEAEIRVVNYYVRPDSIDELDRIAYYDKCAAEQIKHLESLLVTLKELRQEYAARYALLASSPTVPVVRLTREKRYDGKVFYYLSHFRRYVDSGKEIRTGSTTYPGTDRHKAIGDYKAYVKAHPGIIAEMSIEKGRWEK